jgi:hypothetical protein
MQPLHAVPYHFFNMTPWGVERLFQGCEIIESQTFGPLSDTVDWLMRAVGLPQKVGTERVRAIVDELRDLDQFVSPADLRPAASAVFIAARTPKHSGRQHLR